MRTNLINKELSIAVSGVGSPGAELIQNQPAFDAYSFVGGNAAALRNGASAPWLVSVDTCPQAQTQQGRSGLAGMIMEPAVLANPVTEQPTVVPQATKRHFRALAPYPWRQPA